MKAGLRWLFFGNFFLGVCAVLLSVETNCLLHFPHSNIFLFLSFLATVFYYNLAYITEKPPQEKNERSEWYFLHHKKLVLVQWVIGLCTLAFIFLFLKKYGEKIFHQSYGMLCSITLFPLAALLYYGIHPRAFRLFKLREIGWLKPFLIGFSWAGMVTVLPLFFSCVESGVSFSMNREIWVLFLENFLLCSIIAILFDIKDYESDYNLQLKTFVVNKGLHSTIQNLLLPLCLLGMSSVFLFSLLEKYSIQQSAFLLFPFAMLLALSFSLKKEKNIFYYLTIIDGIALLKAICGLIVCSMV